MKTKISSTLVALSLVVGISFFFYSCGSGDDSSTVQVPVVTTIEYKDGDLINDTVYLPPLHDSFSETTGAVVQAILAVNTFIYTDNTVTDLATFEARKAQADQALDILIELAEKTELYADMIPVEEEPTYSSPSRAVATPEEVEAVLGSSKIKWPIKTLMQHYKVNAEEAKAILDDAMAGLVSSYMEDAEFYTKSILVAQVVRDSAALTVAVGGSIITAGGVTGTMGLIDAGAAVISMADASIKAGVSGAELLIGKDGALDAAYKSSVIATGLSDLNELVSIKNLFSTPSNTLDIASNYIYIAGKDSDLLQEKKITFGSHTFELVPVDVPTVALELSVSTEAVFPGKYVFEGSSVIVDYLPVVFISLLENLSEESQVEDTKEAVLATMTLSAVETSRTESDIIYRVTATLIAVYGSVDVTATVGSSSGTQTLTSNGSVSWIVTLHESDATVSVTRSDNGETDLIELEGLGSQGESLYYKPSQTLCEANYPYSRWENDECYADWFEAKKICVMPSMEQWEAVVIGCGGTPAIEYDPDAVNANIANSDYQVCYQSLGYSGTQWYWSSTLTAEFDAWNIFFERGLVATVSPSAVACAIRCVSGGE